MPETKKNGAR